MTATAKRLVRLAGEVQKNPSKTTKRELDAQWIYNNTAIEYPETRLKDARVIARKKS